MHTHPPKIARWRMGEQGTDTGGCGGGLGEDPSRQTIYSGEVTILPTPYSLASLSSPLD